ncbi:flagellar basal body rod protein FlgB [Thermithiobacillus tepidarius DSM 3134]|uniref:flagellar basal body rod protein FlgB n=1 Tax=Thermithiobacillus tepidarius TaxID=929 RepID=UPI0004154198|nr:flagellar basal body rod protein FlgB [Thermithiobacillus tepidarius]
MKNGLDDALRFYDTALSLRTYRQQLLAANITNADTPNYKAVDLDFARALRAAQAGQGGNVNLTVDHPRHLQAAHFNPLGTQAMFRRDSQVGIDGNSVNLDEEQSKFAENAIQYQAGITFLSGKIKSLLTAIRGE